MTSIRRRGLGFVAIVAVFVAGCGDLLQEPDTGIGKTVVRLEEVSGDAQVGTRNAPLAEPLRVRVVDFDGEPAPRLRVQWSVLTGSGAIGPRESFSDAEGIAEATWILGPAGGAQQAHAFVRKGQPVVFEATAE
jgi:hypothetical protein